MSTQLIQSYSGQKVNTTTFTTQVRCEQHINEKSTHPSLGSDFEIYTLKTMFKSGLGVCVTKTGQTVSYVSHQWAVLKSNTIPQC